MKYILVIAFILTHLHIFGQSNLKEIDLQSFVEEVFQVQDEDLNYEDLYESLLLLYTNPLNLNAATSEDLLALYILNPEQVNNFLDYRTQNGQLLSIYELQAIPPSDPV